MELLEILKKIKNLQRKADEVRSLIVHSFLSHDNCAISSKKSLKYANQTSKTKKRVQSHRNIILEISKLRSMIENNNERRYGYGNC